MQMIARENLESLAELIEARAEPLGVGLKRQCWAGVAHQVASARGMRVSDYFGLSFAEMKTAIKENNDTGAAERNAVMVARTRQLAATK